jgi:hypothetical protein
MGATLKVRDVSDERIARVRERPSREMQAQARFGAELAGLQGKWR